MLFHAMKALIDFLNHGLLPFAGREPELERLYRFWEGTFDASELRAVLMLGEGGVGKSRLLDELAVNVERNRGLVVRVKLIPESALSVLALLARSLWYNQESRRLIPSEPTNSITEISAALQRLSRLRPLLLIVEDIHLLEDETSREFALLLQAIASETIALLCVARPFPLQYRAALERYVVDEFSLKGLSPQETDNLLQKVLNRSADAEILEGLHTATGGNPLALRGALRSALNTSLDHGELRSTGSVQLDPKLIAQSAQKSVALLAEGMMFHLLPEEREAAALIASLGEAVGTSGAEVMLGDKPELLDRLIYKGVLAQVEGGLPSLPGNAVEGDTVLTFTHSFLHQSFIELPNTTTQASIARLLGVVGNGLGLYSVLPLRLLGSYAQRIAVSTETIPLLTKTVRRILTVAKSINATPEWQLATEIWNVAQELFALVDESEKRTELLLLEADVHETHLWLTSGRLGVLTENVDRKEYQKHLDRLFVLTSNTKLEGMAERRIDAFRHEHVRIMDSWPECLDVWDRVEQLIQEHPQLFLSDAHIHFLVFIARTIARHGNSESCLRLKQRIKELLADPNATERLKREVHIRISLPILHTFTTEAELQENMAIAEKTATDIRYDYSVNISRRASFHNAYAGLLFISGHMPQAIHQAQLAEKLCREMGQGAGVFQNSLTTLAAEGALGLPLNELLDRAVKLRESQELAQHPRFSGMIGTYLAEVGLLQNQPEWVEHVFAEFAPNIPHHYVEMDVMLALHNETLEQLLPLIPSDTEARQQIKLLIAAALGSGTDTEAAYITATQWIEKPILGTANVLSLHTAILLAHRAKDQNANYQQLDSRISTALATALQWLNKRALFGYMQGILECFPDFIPAKEQKTWTKRIKELAEKREAREERTKPKNKVKVSMLGAITTQAPGEEAKAVRGGRLKTFLGLLVGAAMLAKPLSREEFHRIANGEVSDPNLARKNTNMAAIRLREVLGSDVIQLGEETHELNLEHIEVDLLKANLLLKEALNGLRDRSLLRAGPAIAEVLTLVNGQVPFPGLYDDFFESLREDVEAKIRGAVVAIARALLNEGDAQQAEEILRRAFEAMPEDEEIAELLGQSLIALDKRAEAVLVRMRAEG